MISRPNLTVWTESQVEKLDIQELSCEGVWVNRAGQTVQVTAVKEVVSCAGAIGTPQILQLSGIGPKALLEQHGIEVKFDSPGVGQNLQDHLQIRAVYKG